MPRHTSTVTPSGTLTGGIYRNNRLERADGTIVKAGQIVGRVLGPGAPLEVGEVQRIHRDGTAQVRFYAAMPIDPFPSSGTLEAPSESVRLRADDLVLLIPQRARIRE